MLQHSSVVNYLISRRLIAKIVAKGFMIPKKGSKFFSNSLGVHVCEDYSSNTGLPYPGLIDTILPANRCVLKQKIICV